MNISTLNLFRRAPVSLLSLVCLAALALTLSLAWLPAVRAAPADQTFIVDNPNDGTDDNLNDPACHSTSGGCTLRAAVQQANALSAAQPGARYTILLQTFLVPRTFSLTIGGDGETASATGDLNVKCPLTIAPAGPGNAIIDASSLNDRVFNVDFNGALTLDRITVQHGSGTTKGAGIFAGGPLTLTGSAVLSNTASGGFIEGGGIWGAANQIVVDHSTVRGNVATAGGASPLTSRGGGIFTFGRLFVTDSQIVNNTAAITGTAGTVEGGGIYFAGVVLSMTGSTLSGNVLKQGFDSVANGAGLVSYIGQTRLSGDTIDGNSGALQGGGIFSRQSAAVIERTTIAGNNANVGGGIFVLSSTLSLRGSTVQSNAASTAGGAFVGSGSRFDVLASTFYLNAVSAYGGAMVNTGILTLTNSTLFLNEAATHGAGLYNSGGTATLSSDTLGFNISQFNSVFAGDGGGIYNDVSGLVFMRNTVLANTDVGGEAPDCKGNIVTLDYNLIANTTGCVRQGSGGAHDILNQPSGLTLLSDNGGPTWTSAPVRTSLLIDAAAPGGCVDENGVPLLTDQRGRGRVADGNHDGIARCDIGAYETQLATFLPFLHR